ncbi:hypothetical protein [Nocardia transvalensis]|uniref:hypothetical protein n=1 Tax=Nocardia transvalensis TaxID=37333 RepID=UPI0018935AE7|nr:hypothetical protein [Nocardia transvalensis]MBF6328912.1 hypothetical protein [Nocardia transvalensis]
MSSNVGQYQDMGQYRELAGRLASIMQSGPERAGALNQFIEAVSNPQMFTDMLIAYAGRWFNETGGASVLLGPEMFWALSAPDAPVGNSLAAEMATYAEGSISGGERNRKMLLICLLEHLAQNQWQAATAGLAEPRISTNGLV